MALEKIPVEKPDSYFDMVLRREINDFAELGVDFYLEGFKKARQYADLTPQDAVLDVGCSSGRFVIESAQATEVPSHLIGLDSDDEAYQSYMPPWLDQSRFSFVHSRGESMPLPDNAVKVASGHNVLFRSSEVSAMLGEMKRVVEPDGLLIISTNSREHAVWRHTFERMVAEWFNEEHGYAEPPLKPPAENCYLEDIDHIVAGVGDLEVIDRSVIQFCDARITSDRIDDFLMSVKLSANRTGIPPHMHHVWRRTVDERVRPIVEAHMIQPGVGKPYFAEQVRRGMVVLRKIAK